MFAHCINLLSWGRIRAVLGFVFVVLELDFKNYGVLWLCRTQDNLQN